MEMSGYIGEQGQMSCPLDRRCQCPLMPGADTRLAPWRNLSSIGNILLQLRGILVIDRLCLGNAK